MATVDPILNTDNRYNRTITWSGMTTGDTINSIDLEHSEISNGTIQLSGTWNGGTTVTAEISNDGSTWFTLTDIYGASVSATADAVFEYTTGANFLRFAIASGSADDVTAVVTL